MDMKKLPPKTKRKAQRKKWTGPRAKYIVRDTPPMTIEEALIDRQVNGPRAHVCFGVRWDGSRLMIGGPIGMTEQHQELFKDSPGWRCTDILLRTRYGTPRVKFRAFYVPKGAMTDRERGVAWRKFINTLKATYFVEPVRSFRRLIG